MFKVKEKLNNKVLVLGIMNQAFKLYHFAYFVLEQKASCYGRLVLLFGIIEKKQSNQWVTHNYESVIQIRKYKKKTPYVIALSRFLSYKLHHRRSK